MSNEKVEPEEALTRIETLCKDWIYHHQPIGRFDLADEVLAIIEESQ